MNRLYYGDNLDVLRRSDYFPSESVDLIYLDPPFNSNANYNVLFSEQDGSRAAAQIEAFTDTWRWDEAAAFDYHTTVEQHAGEDVSKALVAMYTLLGGSNMLAYLSMMAPRLMELRRVLKPTGSIYLHCDPTASHYLKLLMDAVFGPQNFRNEIVWKRFNFHADARRFGRVTDRILFYSRSDDYLFNTLRSPFSEEYEAAKFTHLDDDGRRFRLSDLNPPGGRGPVYEFHGVIRPWRITEARMLQLEAEGRIYTKSKVAQLKRYLDELDGQAVHELWSDIAPINPRAKERMHYPTQKPVALLERIIAASSNPGDVVLDPFCGCGTTVVAAQELGREWIGIDITHLAINLIKWRFQQGEHALVAGSDYKVIGEPTDLAGATQLAHDDPYQFQWWALGLVNARPAEQKKGADKGIDGKLLFHDDQGGETKTVIISVKSGHVHRNYIHELRGVIEREGAAIGVFISMETPTTPMKEDAASAGFYEAPWGQRYSRLQLMTIADLLDGRTIAMPQVGVMSENVTLKKPRGGRKAKKPPENAPPQVPML